MIELSKTKAKRKQLIMETAYKMFLDNGVAGTPMNDIAKTCKITRRTIYNYFDTKTDLLIHLNDELVKKINENFRFHYNEKINGLENFKLFLKSIFDNHYTYSREILFLTEVHIYLSHLDNNLDIDDKSNQFNRHFISEFEYIIYQGLEDGSISKKEYDIYALSQMLFQSTYGYLNTVTIGSNISRSIYDRKCQKFAYMITEFLNK